MDPDVALEVARESAAGIMAALDSENAAEILMYAEMLAERFQALDEWLTRGGFLPAAWQR